MIAKGYALLIEPRATLNDIERHITPALEQSGISFEGYPDMKKLLADLKKRMIREASALLILIGPNVANPIDTARRVHRIDSLSQIVFLADAHRKVQLQQTVSPVAMIGPHWSITDMEADNLAAVFQNAVRSSHQRRQHRTTLDRINIQISSPPADAQEYRRYLVSDRFWANILKNARIAIIATDTDGVINTWNHAAERLFCLSQDQAIGRPIQSVASGDWSKQLSRVVAQVESAEPPNFREELVCERLNGTSADVALDVNPVHKKSGVLLGISVIVRDISERKQAEEKLAAQAEKLARTNEELRRSNQELEDFAYIASHDLKEPLRGIHNYSVFLQEDFAHKLNDEGRQILTTMQNLTRRLEILIDSLLYYSRVGRVELSVHDTDLNTVVNEVLESLAATTRDKHIDIRIPQPLPTIRCDSVWVAELFQNLIVNAIKYNDKSEKWLEIGLREEKDTDADTPIFYVKDNGIGIKERHLDKIFRIFRRLHGRDKYGGGTGAGLTIVKKIVERHGGKIWVKSTYGAGTTFYFTLSTAEGRIENQR